MQKNGRENPSRATVRAFSSFLVLWCASGCVTNQLPVAGRDAPVRNVVRASQYAFTTDFALDENDPIVQDLVGLRQTLSETLQLSPGRDIIRVVIFESQQRYNEFLAINFPDLPARRAFFVKQNNQELAIFAFRGKTLLEDLRHEATHALLHSCLPNVPIWLDEGLACYFEVGPTPGSVHNRHIAGLRARNSSRPGQQEQPLDLYRLESLRNLWELSAQDYRESWLVVHFCLHHSPATQQAFREHLLQLKRGVPDSLAGRLAQVEPQLHQSLGVHLSQISQSLGETPVEMAEDAYYQPTHSLWQTSWNATRQLLSPLQLQRN